MIRQSLRRGAQSLTALPSLSLSPLLSFPPYCCEANAKQERRFHRVLAVGTQPLVVAVVPSKSFLNSNSNSSSSSSPTRLLRSRISHFSTTSADDDTTTTTTTEAHQHKLVDTASDADPQQNSDISSSSSSSNSRNSESHNKPWLDVSQSIKLRAEALTEADELHPADFNHPALRQLLRDCSSRVDDDNAVNSSLDGLYLAQSLLDRLVIAKHQLQHRNQMIVAIPEQWWQTILYGWVVRAPQHPVEAEREMRKLVRQAVNQVQQDAVFVQQKQAKNKDWIMDPVVAARGELTTSGFYNTYLYGLSQLARHQPQACQQAEAVLEEMQKLHTSAGWHVKPNTKSYHLVLQAYVATSHVGAGKRALNLLRRMQTVHQTEMQAYLKQYGVPYDLNEASQHDADEVNDLDDVNVNIKDGTATSNRRQIVTPDAKSFTLTMRALGNSDPEHAMELLEEAQNIPGLELDAKLFTQVIKLLAHRIERETNTLKRLASAQQAERILELMVEYASKRHFSGTTLDTQESLLVGYNSLLDVWSRTYCREAAPYCEATLRRMLQDDQAPKPNCISFNSCLHAWSRSHKFHADAALRAEQLLQDQLDACRTGILVDVRDTALPDLQTYTICLLAQADALDINKMQRAVRLFTSLANQVADKQISLGQSTRSSHTNNPNSPFAALLSVIAKSSPHARVVSSTADSKESAAASMMLSEANGVDPLTLATQVYRNWLPHDALGIGTSVPDHHVVAAYLRCVAAHANTRDDRLVAARRIWEEAQALGQVSRLVWKALLVALRGTPDEAEIQNWINQPRRAEIWNYHVPAEYR